MTSFKITFINELSGFKEVIEIPDDKYILDSAIEQNIQLPFSCRAGACSSCVAKLEKGEVIQQDQRFLEDIQNTKDYIFDLPSILDFRLHNLKPCLSEIVWILIFSQDFYSFACKLSPLSPSSCLCAHERK